ncbi:hypothetical protein Clacol_007443 [Clathrus columnatus]|uniref:F-box domain-containing protein n=1 Tax=Clathrus columnatus TaxID=1419009 RepID=A0AAV5AHH7_9AGAM|nr:hypothetical protein Clacol_007443 [Clathrus columnatus]
MFMSKNTSDVEYSPSWRLSIPASSSIQGFPEELLRIIFWEALPTLRRPSTPFDKLDEPLRSNETINPVPDYLTHPHFIRVSISLVCRRWRKLVLETHWLWSVYQLDHSLLNFKPELLEHWISLAKGHPLDVLLIPRKWLIHEPQPFYQILFRYCQQIRIYIAEFMRPRASSSLDIFSQHSNASILELPYLEELIINSGDFEPPVKIFAPKLRVLQVGRRFSVLTNDSFKKLSKWTLMSGSSVSIDPVDLNKKLALCHSLEYFYVNTINLRLRDPFITLPHSLKEFRLVGAFCTSMLPLFFRLDVPNIEILVIVSWGLNKSVIPQWTHQLLKGLLRLRRLTLENFRLDVVLSKSVAVQLDALELRNCALDKCFHRQVSIGLHFLVLDNCDFCLEDLLYVLQARTSSISQAVLPVLIRHSQEILRDYRGKVRGFPSVVLLESTFITST